MVMKIKLPGNLRREFSGLSRAQVDAKFSLLTELSIKHGGVPFVVSIGPEEKK